MTQGPLGSAINYSNAILPLPTQHKSALPNLLRQTYQTLASRRNIDYIPYAKPLTNALWLADPAIIVTLGATFFNQDPIPNNLFWMTLNQITGPKETYTRIINDIQQPYDSPQEDPTYRIHTLYLKSGITNLLKEIPTNFKENKIISLALQGNVKHTIRVLQHENMTLIITNEYDWNISRKLIACIPLLYPALNITDENLLQLYQHLGTSNEEAWINAFKIWFNKSDYANTILKQGLEHLMSSTKTETLIRLEQNIHDSNRLIDDYLHALQNQYDTLQRLRKDRIATELSEVAGYQELFDFLQHNTNTIQDIKIQPPCLYCTIRTPLTFWDEKLFKTLYENPRSSLHNYGNFLKWFVSKIFLTKEYKLITQSPITIDIGVKERRINTEPSALTIGFPHPHLHRYNCYGDNKPHIIKAIKNNDLIGALSQIVGASFNINWGDYTVIETFLKNISQHNYPYPCVQIDNTENLHTTKAIKKIYEEELINEANKNNGTTEEPAF